MNQTKPLSFLQIMAFIWKRGVFTLILNSFNLLTKASVANCTEFFLNLSWYNLPKIFLKVLKVFYSFLMYLIFFLTQNVESWQHWLDKDQTGNLVKIINKKQSWLKIDQRLNGDHLLLNNWDVATLGADSQGLLTSLLIPSTGKRCFTFSTMPQN